ncbi:four-carbon acid sugar kinase family protein [Streptomyces sp. B6B3]|uniref:four-carbon acid sugar kinase family protein n=1 Tax=Streptomyces sp. B6B3 TaxID=3153570 RepID=UPI00325F1321
MAEAAARRLAAGFYGDDVTGSTDALAQYHRAGLRGLLLFDRPDPGELAALAGAYDVVGVAGVARSLPTERMAEEVEPVLAALRAAGPRVVQYKMCSTADSSPRVGSLGRAIEIGRAVFGPAPVPVLAAQPEFGRYTAFGHHFAADGGTVYRLDRQPTMSRHPVTPMTEADLRVHLGRQTALPVGSLDLTAYELPAAEAHRRYRGLLTDGDWGAVVLDAVTDAHLRCAAELILAGGDQVYALGSGGLSHGLARALAEHLPDAPPRAGVPRPDTSRPGAPPPDQGWSGDAGSSDVPGPASSVARSEASGPAWSAGTPPDGSWSGGAPPSDVPGPDDLPSRAAPPEAHPRGGPTSGVTGPDGTRAVGPGPEGTLRDSARGGGARPAAFRGARTSRGGGPDAGLPPARGPVLVVSGSCAPRTAAQIRWALDHGWGGVAVDPDAADAGSPAALDRLRDATLRALAAAPGAVVYTALGPATRANSHANPLAAVGAALAHAVAEAVAHAGVRRVVVAGGDTAGQVVRALGARTAEIVALLGPGTALCRLGAPHGPLDGVQILLKGGQAGDVDLFPRVRGGAGGEPRGHRHAGAR